MTYMLRSISKYLSIFIIQVTNRLAYPGDLAAQSLSIVLFMWIFMQLWRTTYRSTGTESINGLTLQETLWYLMMAETIMLSKPRVSRTIAESVRDGSIAYLLNKPYNYLLYQVSIGLGDSLTHLIFNIAFGGIVVWLLVGPPPDPRGWPMVFLTMIVAWLLDFCVNALIGLAAFVTEEVSAFEWIYSKFLLLLGGILIPLDFFPTWLRTIAQALPFAYMIYGPARLFVDPEIPRFISLLFGQLLWLSIFGLVVILVYKRGVSRLSINGG